MDELSDWIKTELKRSVFSATELSSAFSSPTFSTRISPTDNCGNENCRLCNGTYEQPALNSGSPKPEPKPEKLLDSVAEFMAGKVDPHGA